MCDNSGKHPSSRKARRTSPLCGNADRGSRLYTDVVVPACLSGSAGRISHAVHEPVRQTTPFTEMDADAGLGCAGSLARRIGARFLSMVAPQLRDTRGGHLQWSYSTFALPAVHCHRAQSRGLDADQGIVAGGYCQRQSRVARRTDFLAGASSFATLRFSFSHPSDPRVGRCMAVGRVHIGCTSGEREASASVMAAVSERRWSAGLSPGSVGVSAQGPQRGQEDRCGRFTEALETSGLTSDIRVARPRRRDEPFQFTPRPFSRILPRCPNK